MFKVGTKPKRILVWDPSPVSRPPKRVKGKGPRSASTYRGARHNAAKAEQHKQVLARRAARNANV